ncbi:glycosyltransferase [Raineyella sp. W15-4]|uniref:glycosyltransferase n=1 Tax=Raineyella sp. W15-4 TaxID=3081651 RepID=UPI002954CF8A|nr:glycosyltransferase [Raineyella sp. W15-4]WOQ16968.1 glycosyltransferase [Raineyella sp. W15-4]
MRIVVNDIAASGGGGALSVLRSFHGYVRDHDEENDWVFLLGSDLLDESAHVRTIMLPAVKNSWLRRLFFDLVSGRYLLASLKPDVVLSLQNTFTYGARCPQIVYVHQSLPFQRAVNFSLWRGDERFLAIYQHVIGAIIKRSVRHATRVIVQTEWMRDAVVDQVGLSEDRVEAILPDLEDLSAYAFEGAPDAGAFFYPTAAYSYKNNDCIYMACRLLRQRGTVDFSVTMTVDSPSLDPNVVAIGRVPREQVLEMLSRSTLVFPSLVETYGVPLAEARALGVLVLAADLPYAREVLDGYSNAYFFDPKSPSELAVLMSNIINGNIVRRWDCPEVPRTGAWARVVETIEYFGRGAGQV